MDTYNTSHQPSTEQDPQEQPQRPRSPGPVFTGHHIFMGPLVPDTYNNLSSPCEDTSSGTPSTMDMNFDELPILTAAAIVSSHLGSPPSYSTNALRPHSPLQLPTLPLPMELPSQTRLQQRVQEQKRVNQGGEVSKKRPAEPAWNREEVEEECDMDVSSDSGSDQRQEPVPQCRRRQRQRRRRRRNNDQDHLPVFYKKPEKPRAVMSKALLARADATYATWLAACDTPMEARPQSDMCVPAGHVHRPGAWLAYLWCLQAQLCHSLWTSSMLKVVRAFPWAFDAAVADVDFATDSIGPSCLAIASKAYDLVREECVLSGSIVRQLKRKFYTVQRSTHARGSEWLSLKPAPDHEQRWQRKVGKLREESRRGALQ